ncbi:MAG TPA: hypothetical protein VI749_02935 [Candidatus Omnitrophota bacterium]|nr:hypothetical protein [Candidatus Omnitrophota bacterium]
MSPQTINKEELAETFRRCVQRSLEQYCQVVFTKDPKVEQLDLIEYESRMRIFGLEKFNGTCYISLVNLYESPLEAEHKDPCGVLLVYVEEENAERLFKALLKGVQGEDEELIAENTQKLCIAVFEQLKKELSQFGYPGILMSAPENYLSNAEQGVDFPYDEDTLYQVSCILWREKIVVAELVLASAKHG